MAKRKDMKLLEELLVLDFSQFLSGPSASLRLADMGARVIKIERPGTGDICRELYVSDTKVKGESTIFHAINRNKESYQADLKDPLDLQQVKALIKKADVLIHNFRPGVMERIGLSYEVVSALNPQLVYASISGYGAEGEWKDWPGQDLLLQGVSGITYLSGNRDDAPTPMGVAAADIIAGTHLVQGILAALFGRFTTGTGKLVEVNMLESLLDFQFEVLTCFYNDGHELPERSAVNNGHAYIAAPYGIYKTGNGYLALAMGNILDLGRLLGCDALLAFTNPGDWFDKRDEIKSLLRDFLLARSAKEWLAILEPADIWCAEVLDYDALKQEEGYTVLEMEQEVTIGDGLLKTTRCPIRVDGELLNSPKGAPALGEHTAAIKKEFNL
jgi:crotonobetainyl-CoA:carnitine CoA-transferase CaiB-like acyl-CoA transferase